MTDSHQTAELFRTVAQKFAARQREFLLQLATEIAVQQQKDVAEVMEALASQMPDITDIASESAGQQALSGIIDDSLLNPLAQATLAGILDDSLRKTLAQTGFVEALLENLKLSLAQADLSETLGECLKKLSVLTYRSDAFDEHLSELAVHGDFSKLLDERMGALADERYFSDVLGERANALAAEADFADLLSERIRARGGANRHFGRAQQGHEGIVRGNRLLRPARRAIEEPGISIRATNRRYPTEN